MQDGEDFGPWLARQLKRQNLKQVDLANRLGVTRAAVSAWIAGRAQPRPEMMKKLALELGTDIATVLDRTTDADTVRPIAWYHRPAHADGGREFGNAAAFAFDADLAVLAREVTQNSLDERLDATQPVRVRFTLQELNGEHLRSFLDAIRWQELQSHYRAAVASGQKAGKALAAGLRDLDETGTLLLLRVDDYNASGLTGPEYGDGRYAAVVRRQLDSHKNSSKAGGSYGLGKATLWAASRLGMVLMNSTLSTPHEGRTERRVIGRLDLPWREVDGHACAGPAWLGEPDPEVEYEGVSRSWWADEETVSTLKLTRDGTAPGTSFLVLGAHDAGIEADAHQTPHQALHDKLVDALADNFWAAMTSGRDIPALLEASVVTLINDTVLIPEQRVDPRTRHPALTRALRAHMNRETVPQLTGLDEVISTRVPLTVPPLRTQARSGGAAIHEAVLLVTPADGADQQHSRIVCMRGSRMTITTRRPQDIGMGAEPFQAVLLAGLATGEESEEAARAEAFLRAAEPPEHDRWGKTEELASTYARGSLTRLKDFRVATDARLRELIGHGPAAPKNEGPELLRGLLRLDAPATGRARRAESHPTVAALEGEVDESGAWNLRIRLRLPQRDDPWSITPVAKFDVRSGSRPVLAWAALTASENCRIVDDVVLIDAGVRHAAFTGTTAPDSHPVSSMLAGIMIDLQTTSRGAAPA
ncbi:DNA-binding protein [Streptomyces sp. NRRL F-5122]|uniref:helix-turn-helix domain-containing protein n=1 Tax=Streptomyces sp. NRRL F-5122 TaxID=1609098 RepID=UPI0007410D22|nr:helix-turn-helix transcriptional regulator [Streptomyces sp. NRRL F-5122]KUJ36165.1 DNA-binding protein [Streptomyces sp. NRRL F-5122]